MRKHADRPGNPGWGEAPLVYCVKQNVHYVKTLVGRAFLPADSLSSESTLEHGRLKDGMRPRLAAPQP